MKKIISSLKKRPIIELFQAEQAALAGRLTGRQQFLRDATLSLSDIALIQEADENNIQIDESLFQVRFLI